MADLKTLDVGKLEVDFVFDAIADAAVASGLVGSKDNFSLMECPRDEPKSNGGLPGFNLLTILIIGILVFLPILRKCRNKLK